MGVMPTNTDTDTRPDGPKVCILCGIPFTGWGHNPEPVVPFESGRACTDCNATKVIPTRFGRRFTSEEN